jgi:hypothetical protein
MPTIVSKREYAEHRNIALPTVSAAIRSGRLKNCLTGDGKIDLEVADAEWASNTNAEMSWRASNRADSYQQPGNASTFAGATSTSQAAPTPAGPGAAPNFNESRAWKEFYDSQRAKLKYEETLGALAPMPEVKNFLYSCGQVVKQGHASLIVQLAPQIASMTSITAVEKLLKREFERIDNDLADKIQKMELTHEPDTESGGSD